MTPEVREILLSLKKPKGYKYILTYPQRETLQTPDGKDVWYRVKFEGNRTHEWMLRGYCLVRGAQKDPVWVNLAGGWRNGTPEILDVAIAEQAADLDWTGTWLDDPSSKSGWLSPEGVYHGCPWMEHDLCARYLLKDTIEGLGMKGWVRYKGVDDWLTGKGNTITQMQMDWLGDHGNKDFRGITIGDIPTFDDLHGIRRMD